MFASVLVNTMRSKKFFEAFRKKVAAAYLILSGTFNRIYMTK